MNRVLLIIGGLLVGLLAALFSVPALVDWTRYRGVFEEEATRLLGRDVRVGGKVNMRLLPSPYIRFEKVRVADTQATVGEPLFRADDFTIWLSVGPLFSGTLQASEIELRKPYVTLVVDEQGRGNWSSLATTESKSKLTPGSISLDYVRITNGTVAVFNSTGIERTRFEHVNGELTAAGIEGPYRLAAAFSHDGATREVRLATAKPDADGGTRFKGTVRAPESGASYTLDGQLQDIFKQARLTGELTAKMPLQQAAADAGGKRSQQDASFDIKAAVQGNTQGLALSDIAVSFEQDGKPQLATGHARIDWQKSTIASAELSSRWLDLDRIGGRDSAAPLSTMLLRFLNSLDATIPAAANTSVRLVLDQATLGGEAVSGLTLTIARKDGLLTGELSAALPGATRLYANGVLTPANKEQVFAGDVSLRGASLGRFSGWAFRNSAVTPPKQDSAFVMSGRVALGPDRVSGRDLTLQFGANSVTGSAGYTADTQGRQISLDLEGPELDLTPFMAGAGPASLLPAIAAHLPSVAKSAVADGKLQPDAASVSARLRIGRLIAGRSTLNDVTADVTYAGGNLAIPLVRLGTEGRWSLEFSGDVAGLVKAAPRGNATFSATAETPEGLAELLGVLEAGDALVPAPRRAAAALPLRMAGRIKMGEGLSDFAFDGTLAQVRTSGTVRLDPKGESWRDWRADAALSFDSRDGGRLLELMAPELFGASANTATRPPATLVWRGIGTAKTGLASLLAFEATGLSSEFRGKIGVSDTAVVTADGALRITTPDAGQSLALFGLRERTPLVGRPANGMLSVVFDGKRQKLETQRLEVGTAVLSGQIEREVAADGTQRLSGKIVTPALSLPTGIALMTAGRPAKLATDTTLQPSIWAEEAFDLSMLTGLTGAMRIETADLQLAPGISVGAAVVEAQAVGGRLEFKFADSAVLGAGKLAGSLKLERASAGAKATVDVRLAGGKLEARALSGQPPFASGILGFKLTTEGQALSPRGLVAGLSGTGEISLGKTTLNRLANGAVAAARGEILKLPAEAPESEMRRLITTAIAGGTTEIPARTLGIVVNDGVVRIAPLVVENGRGDQVTGISYVDLEAMKIDSEWRIEASKKSDQSVPEVVEVPGISLVYTGPLAALGAITPQINAEAFERTLTVRRMEHQVKLLEGIRRQDEERARLEGERQRQLESERQRLLDQQRAAISRDPSTPPDTSIPGQVAPPAVAPALISPGPVETAPATAKPKQESFVAPPVVGPAVVPPVRADVPAGTEPAVAAEADALQTAPTDAAGLKAGPTRVARPPRPAGTPRDPFGDARRNSP